MVAVRCRNTPFHELEEFVWTWEIEEEFRDYIPAYIDMLHEVDKMGDCLERKISAKYWQRQNDEMCKFIVNSSILNLIFSILVMTRV